DLVLAAADVAVERAGASTVSELAVAGVPSILVPLPGAPSDHQTANACRLAQAGAAVLIPDDELDHARLGTELDRLLDSAATRRSMGAAAQALAHPDAAADVARLAEAHARG
ncbi:MAG TPA: glycosyltransferase, partial [Acidimicrobiales bacterium]|nr:glycosyltransferase [Acidimicrobiales bacterium]